MEWLQAAPRGFLFRKSVEVEDAKSSMDMVCFIIFFYESVFYPICMSLHVEVDVG